MEESNTRSKGYCKWMNKSGWGFIVGSDGKEYFAHYKEIRGSGFRTLAEEELVTFEPGQNEKGLVAKDIVSE